MRSIDIDYCRNKIRQEKTKKKEKKNMEKRGIEEGYLIVKCVRKEV